MSVTPDPPPGEGGVIAPLGSGHPGDHWKTDLLTWGLPVFGEPADGFLREVFGLGGEGALDGQPWLQTLVQLSPASGQPVPSHAQLEQLTDHLRRLLDTLRGAPLSAPTGSRRRWRSRKRQAA